MNAYGILKDDSKFLSKEFKRRDPSSLHFAVLDLGGPNSLDRPESKVGRSTFLSHLLVRHKSKLCSDPRDKVYSLLNLLDPDEMPKSCPIDYTLDVMEVFITLARFLITTKSSLDVLAISREMEALHHFCLRGFQIGPILLIA
jgi:hypothetical protein